jgi:hypothetical protein
MLIPQKPTKQTNKNQPAPSAVDFDHTAHIVDFTAEITQQVIISIQGHTILTAGSLLVLTGKPKARKSTFLHTFLGVAIKSTSLWQISAQLPSERKKVILVDTEQSLYDLHSSIKRMAYNFSIDLANTGLFQVYSSRTLALFNLITLIETILENNKDCGLLAIDGLIDLCNDINDVKEAKAAITFIKQIADKYQIGIIGVLHQNKGTNFSLGHLGSFASRFAQSELSVTKNEDSTSTLEAVFLRSAETIQPISIGWDSVNNRYDDIERLRTASIHHATIAQQIFANDLQLSYARLVQNAIEVTKSSQYQVTKKLIPELYDLGLIHKVGNYIVLK